MNKFIGIGRLTRDVELRYSESGTAVGNFSIAINRPFKNKQTNDYDADFINCVAFGKTAENLANFMKKGSQIAVEGRVQTRNYEKDGKRVYVTEIVADNIQFLETRQTQRAPTQQNAFEAAAGKQDAFENVDIPDDDLPF